MNLLLFVTLFLVLVRTGLSLKMAIIGEGVIGLSTAMALKELDPSVEVRFISLLWRLAQSRKRHS